LRASRPAKVKGRLVEPAAMPSEKTATITLRLSLRSIELIRYVSALTNKRYGEVVEDAILYRYRHLLEPKRLQKGVITL
jgi:hypothetical protein